MNNKPFINNIISEFPIFILKNKYKNLIINYIKQVALKIADAKDEQYKELIRNYKDEINYSVEKFINNRIK